MPKPAWGGAATSAVSGAATGAMGGSLFGPVGTGVGAVVGGAAGFFSGLFGGKKKRKPKKYSTLDARQEKLYAQQVAALNGEGEFADLYNFDPEAANANFEQNVSRPAYRNFNEEVIPGITGQFRGGNIGNSSYTGEALGRAGRNVQEGLNAARSNMIYQGTKEAKQNKMNAIENMLNRSTFAYDTGEEGEPGAIDQILDSLGPAAGKWVENYFNSKQNAPAATPAATPAAATI